MTTYHIFKNSILKFIRPKPNGISSIQNFEGLKLLTRMRLGLSHLAHHKFRHNFQDYLNPIYSCGQEMVMLFGSEKLKDDKNNALLTSSIKFIQSKERFKYPLFQS